MDGIRVDRWLWATRFYKTRSLATDACKRKLIRINNTPLKPSREIKVGEVIEIKRGPLKMTIKVTAFLEKRVSATKAQECYEDLTPPDEYESAKREAKRLKPLPIGSSSKGRPSKKQRRDLEEFLFNEGLNS